MYWIKPHKCLGEVGIVLGVASIAQNLATNIVGKAPAGVGLAAKGALHMLSLVR